MDLELTQEIVRLTRAYHRFQCPQKISSIVQKFKVSVNDNIFDVCSEMSMITISALAGLS
jgi:hypothetical protein